MEEEERHTTLFVVIEDLKLQEFSQELSQATLELD